MRKPSKRARSTSPDDACTLLEDLINIIFEHSLRQTQMVTGQTRLRIRGTNDTSQMINLNSCRMRKLVQQIQSWLRKARLTASTAVNNDSRVTEEETATTPEINTTPDDHLDQMQDLIQPI